MRKDEEAQYGPNLMAYVDAELQARGHTPSAWAARNGITVSDLGRFRSGSQVPTVYKLAQIARALDVPAAQILAVTLGQADGAPVVTQPPRVVDAIRLDPELSDDERAWLHDVYAGFQKFRTGTPVVTNVKPAKKRHR